jgi:hypothetical protein
MYNTTNSYQDTYGIINPDLREYDICHSYNHTSEELL